MAFREIKIEELQFNPFTKIGKEWLLITAGDEKKHNTMTASWGGFGENCREALALCGKVSGRDGDKIKEAGLTPYFVDGTTAFEEAEMIFVCRKLYADEIKPEKFIATENDARWYPQKDYHTMYIAEITKVLVKEA